MYNDESHAEGERLTIVDNPESSSVLPMSSLDDASINVREEAEPLTSVDEHASDSVAVIAGVVAAADTADVDTPSAFSPLKSM
jgi:hypothetical protein